MGAGWLSNQHNEEGATLYKIVVVPHECRITHDSTKGYKKTDRTVRGSETVEAFKLLNQSS